MKKIMILGASILQVPAIIQAKKMKLETVVLDSNENAIGFKNADIKLNISTMDTRSVIQAAIDYQVDGIMTLATDAPINVIASVNERLGFSGIDKDTAFNVTNKIAMRNKLCENLIPIPKFHKVTNLQEFIKEANNYDGKFMVKSPDSSGSRGVSLVTSNQDMEQLNSAYKYSEMFSGTGEVLIEEYMEGPEVSVESITIDGKTTVVAITDKKTTGAPNFVEVGHSIPSLLGNNTKKNIIDLTIKTIKALRINNSVAHTEIIITDEGPKVVEIGARLGGGNITTHLVPLATGVNLVEKSIRLALGEKPKIVLSESQKNGAAIRYLLPEKGKISEIIVNPKTPKIKEVKDIGFFKTIGDSVDGLKDGSDRIGYVITQSKKVERAIDIAEKTLLNNIQIKYC